MDEETQTLSSIAVEDPKVEETLTVLLVDDDPDCRMMLRDAITSSRAQHRVYEVDNAEEAWKFLQRRAPYSEAPRPGLIYLDIEMPGLDGLALLKKIKKDPDLERIVTVMMTGVDDEKYIRLAAAAGANSYTIKPADADRFLRMVIDSTNYWLRIHQYSPEARGT